MNPIGVALFAILCILSSDTSLSYNPVEIDKTLAKLNISFCLSNGLMNDGTSQFSTVIFMIINQALNKKLKKQLDF